MREMGVTKVSLTQATGWNGTLQPKSCVMGGAMPDNLAELTARLGQLVQKSCRKPTQSGMTNWLVKFGEFWVNGNVL
jgi:hypothetical protein